MHKQRIICILEMQGCFGIPELIGVAEIKNERGISYLYYKVRQYSKEPPKNMTVTEMALQLFKTLQIVHEAGVVHRCLDRLERIRWHNNEIKVTID